MREIPSGTRFVCLLRKNAPLLKSWPGFQQQNMFLTILTGSSFRIKEFRNSGEKKNTGHFGRVRNQPGYLGVGTNNNKKMPGSEFRVVTSPKNFTHPLGKKYPPFQVIITGYCEGLGVAIPGKLNMYLSLWILVEKPGEDKPKLLGNTFLQTAGENKSQGEEKHRGHR